MSKKSLTSIHRRRIAGCQRKKPIVFCAFKSHHDEVSDHIMFGHFVSVYFKDVFQKNMQQLKLGVNPDLGLDDLYKKIEKLDLAKRNRNRSGYSGCL